MVEKTQELGNTKDIMVDMVVDIFLIFCLMRAKVKAELDDNLAGEP
jgi:hypothetical protein